MRCPDSPRVRGITLVEMVVTIAITGIVAAMVAAFIRLPVLGYVDTVRRVALTDEADTALRRMVRDIRMALPNSIRVSADGYYLEYLQTSGGGRYREQPDATGAGDTLDFSVSDQHFDVIGPLPAFSGSEAIVVYNLFADAALSMEANAYVGDNRAAYVSSAGSTITIAGTKFPFESAARRFQVVQYPVTYACNPVTHELRRYWAYAIAQNQPTPPSTTNNALLASHVSACRFSYQANAIAQRNGVVSLDLTLEQEGDQVRLFQQVHVSNVP